MGDAIGVGAFGCWCWEEVPGDVQSGTVQENGPRQGTLSGTVEESGLSQGVRVGVPQA